MNRSFGNLLRSLVGSNIRQWDLILAQVEFAYNRSPSQTTGTSPFEEIHGQNPHGPLDLIPFPITKLIFIVELYSAKKKIIAEHHY